MLNVTPDVLLVLGAVAGVVTVVTLASWLDALDRRTKAHAAALERVWAQFGRVEQELDRLWGRPELTLYRPGPTLQAWPVARPGALIDSPALGLGHVEAGEAGKAEGGGGGGTVGMKTPPES